MDYKHDKREMEWKENIATYCMRGGERLGRGLPTRVPHYSPLVCLSFMAPVIVSKCSEDAFHFIVHIHTLVPTESLQNDSFCLDSFHIKVGKIIRKS